MTTQLNFNESRCAHGARSTPCHVHAINAMFESTVGPPYPQPSELAIATLLEHFTDLEINRTISLNYMASIQNAQGPLMRS